MHIGLLRGPFSGSPFLTGVLNFIVSREEIALKQLFCNWFLLLLFFQQVGHFFPCLFFLFLLLKGMACYQKCIPHTSILQLVATGQGVMALN